VAERRRTFGPAVLVGLASAALVAVAGNQAWAKAAEGQGIGEEVASVSVAVGEAKAPLATALALVVLAAWGVVLVTRGRFRRVISWVLAVATAGLLADAVADAYAPYGITEIDVQRTAWSWVALAGSVLALAAAALAVRDVGRWPAMGKRYDAPGATEEAPAPGERSNLDLWKTMDEGRDPTE
jgi:tryptophan-associated transmembrane protein